MKELYKLGLKPALHYPAKLFVMLKNKGKERPFSLKEAQELALLSIANGVDESRLLCVEMTTLFMRRSKAMGPVA